MKNLREGETEQLILRKIEKNIGVDLNRTSHIDAWTDHGYFMKNNQITSLAVKFEKDTNAETIFYSIQHLTHLKKLSIYEYNNEILPVDLSQLIHLEKLKISEEQFNEIMNLPIKNHLDYPTYHSTIKRMKLFIKLACILKLLPDVVYEKYAK